MSWRTDDQEMAGFHPETKKKNRFEKALQTDRHTDIQAGRRLDSVPVSGVVALAAKVGPAVRLSSITSSHTTKTVLRAISLV